MARFEYYDKKKKHIKKMISYNGRCELERSKVTIYHETGKVKYEFYLHNGQFHNLYGPAVIWYYEDGSVKYQDWHINGDKIEPPYDNYPLTLDQTVELKLIHG